jgi:hypothetical protein
MKKLIVAAVALAAFTLNGLDPLLLVGMIAFSGGVFAVASGPGKNQRTSFSVVTRYMRRPASRPRLALAPSIMREIWQIREPNLGVLGNFPGIVRLRRNSSPARRDHNTTIWRMNELARKAP